MELKLGMAEKPLTPPESPESALRHENALAPPPGSPSRSPAGVNGHHGSSGGAALQRRSSVASSSGTSPTRRLSHTSHADGQSRGPRPMALDPINTSGSTSMLPATSTTSSAYPTPSTVGEQLSAYQRDLAQKARLLVGAASASVSNFTPSPSAAYTSGQSQQRTPTRSTFPSSALQVSPGSSRRQLTSQKSKEKDDLPRDPFEQTPPLWKRLLGAVSDSLPSFPTTGPKRVRTRARRFLIFLVSLGVLCYFFGNTLQEAYRSAAVASEERAMEQLEQERLGPHIQDFDRHPIAKLMEDAEKEWNVKVARQSKTPEEGIAEYKRRYKRDPPDGFKEWFEYAKEQNTVLIDEYDSLMKSLEPFWALEAAELRRRTFQIGLQPSFALVHVEEAIDKNTGGTFWDANEDDELLKPFGVERARGFERMVRPFVGRPGMVNMVFAINELAEPRVLVPWEEKQIIEEALKTNTTVNLRQPQLPGRSKTFFPDPVWKGDGTTWETFIRTCPPDTAARKVFTTMTNSVIHLADVLHVAYAKSRRTRGRGKVDIVADTVNEDGDVELQVNPERPLKRKKSQVASPPAAPALEELHDSVLQQVDAPNEKLRSSQRPGQDGWPTRDVHLPGPEFQFNNNVTGLSHDMLCNDPRLHDTQGQFCSDFRSLDSLYPVFSPSTMPGFSDVVIPSHYYAATGPKYHLLAHMKRHKELVEDPITGKMVEILVDDPLPAWETRYNKIFWRGSTTGGGNNPAGRQLQYQRHRFLRLSSDNTSTPTNVILPPLTNTSSADMAFVELPSDIANEQAMDIAFTSLDGCGHQKVCDAVKYGMYKMGQKVPLMEITKYKMLLDLDGMAYSARFMALLESGAAVLKSTIYTEYYSDQIQPWYHFIPVSILYEEIYNIYSYFLGAPASPVPPSTSDEDPAKDSAKPDDDKRLYQRHTSIAAPLNSGAHEEALERIGALGKKWQTEFGKNTDMQVYCYRLALEWGRLWQRGEHVGTF